MKIKCVTIDDEPLALRQVSDFVRKTEFLELVAECRNALEALDILNSQAVDLLFIDINMPGMSGMDLVKSLAQPPGIIFTTAYSEFALEGFRVDAIDYLLKPIGYNAFLKAATKARDTLIHRREGPAIHPEEGHFFVKSEYRVVRINFNDIRYIEGMREYVRIYLENQKPVMSLMSMKSLEKHLPSEMFMRVHRSFIVNLQKINTVERSRIIFDKDVYIPVSDQYKEKFQAYIDKFFL